MTLMHSRRWLRAGAVIVALLFVAGEALARGGRGGGRGGGGGGRSISRSSPAAGGLGSMQRARSPQRSSSMQRGYPSRANVSSRPASTRPAARPGGAGQGQQRPAQGQRPAQRPGGDAANRPAQRPSGDASDRQTQRQDAASDRIDQRDQNRDDAREDWQDYGNDRQEDRQDAWDDVEWDNVHIYDDDDFEWNAGAWMVLAAGTAVTVAAFNSMQQQAGCNLFQTEVDGTTYYKCGNTWYIEAVTGGNVQYVAVAPPPGF